MKDRIVAAWKVLRGEWIAQAPVQVPSAWIYNPPSSANQCGTGSVTWKWMQP